MTDGLVLGALTWLSFIFSFKHFPQRIKKFLLNNFFITDMLSILLTFFLLTSISKSLIAVIASMVCGLLINLTLIAHRFFCPQYY
jgi:VanZ family protein